MSTAQSYDSFNMNLTTNESTFTLQNYCGLEGYFDLLNGLENDFEAIQFKQTPILLRIKEELMKDGAKLARMSGSGPTMFGLFEKNWKSSRGSKVSFPDCQLHTVEPFLWPKHEIPQI